MKFLFAVIATVLTPRVLFTQEAPGSPTLVEIRTSAQADTELPAVGALLSVQFSDRRRTPAQAGRANAIRASMIRQALVGLGIPTDSITTSGYSSMMNVGPNLADTAFIATNSFRVRMSQLGLVSRAIDTALTAGATQVSDLRFWARGVEQTRLDLLGAATRRARQQAEILARAAGGHLGRLLELSTDAPSRYDARPFGFDEIVATGVNERVPTPIQAAAIRVSVTVYTRWEFVATP